MNAHPQPQLPAPFLVTSLDLGQAQDPTGLAVVECTSAWRNARHDSIDRSFAVRHLERFPAGTPYPKIVERLIDMFHLHPLRRTRLTFDLTAVGRPVADLFRYAKIEGSSRCIAIVPGEPVNGFNIFPWQIGKKDLVGLLQVSLQTGRIKIAPGLEYSDILLAELANFRIKPSNIADPIGDWRTGPHDDLVLAVAIGVWECERPTFFPPTTSKPVKREPLFPEKW